ncbi:diguanylate cyclase domain-containing protein [Pararhodospirillum photometricum]|uniref:FOG: PAS/PAC domain n=1 Tax=Pararhodospirillum photometricum DSM 122 TaxID=1150469 RepID=H6SM54_PARPM|nr:diguanylate cyclase [Pararhodospirillum photometricum]CCG09069.1 FOG: PAS/PAC domain [Pararhodospirillum photometricum DSM 122]
MRAGMEQGTPDRKGFLAGWKARRAPRSSDSGALVAALNKAVFDAVADGIVSLDREGRVTFLNRAAQTLGQCRERDSLGRRGEEVFPFMAALPTLDTIPRERFEVVLCGCDGEIIPLEIVAAPIIEARQVTGTVVVFRDIRERRHAEESRRLAAAVVEWSPQAIVVADLGGMIIIVNPAFSRLSGFASEDIVGKPVSVLRSDHHDAAFHAALRQTLDRDGLWCGEVWNRHKDGTPYAVWLSITRVSAEAGGGFLVGFYFDITERKRHEARILQEANHDALTGLPNRRMVEEGLEIALAQARRGGHRVAVLLIDLDGFKAVNDTHGHDAGDVLLCEMARRMAATLRVGDMVARLGGDEFLVLLAPLGDDAENGARRVARHLVEQIARPVLHEDISLRVSASIGIAIGDGTCEGGPLIKQADQAMYVVKRSGKHGFHFYEANKDDKEEA